MNMHDMIAAQDKAQNRDVWDACILVFDPGHTTGYAVFHGNTLVDAGQIKTDNMELAPRTLKDLIEAVAPAYIICEDYRVYKWRKDHHVGSEMLTTRVIGAIETIASFHFVPVIKNMAVVAKRFVTDARLREWGLWRENEKHARDAIRHGCYFLIFRHHMLGEGKTSKSHTVG